MSGSIYKATSPTGMVYVGKTTKSLEERIKKHHRDADHYDMKMSRAIRKYGIENFKWEILEENVDLSLLDEREIFYINLFDSYANGLNSTFGGDGGSPMLGKKHSEQTKKKIKETNLKTYEKIKDKFTGLNNPFFGKKHDDKTKEIMRQKKLGVKWSLNDERRKSISERMKDKKHPMYRGDITNDMIRDEVLRCINLEEILNNLKISRTMFYSRLRKMGYRSFIKFRSEVKEIN